MVLFTAPDDMIIGKGLQVLNIIISSLIVLQCCCVFQTKIDHVSETAVKELKTVSTLHDTAINYEVIIITITVEPLYNGHH